MHGFLDHKFFGPSYNEYILSINRWNYLYTQRTYRVVYNMTRYSKVKKDTIYFKYDGNIKKKYNYIKSYYIYNYCLLFYQNIRTNYLFHIFVKMW